MKQTKKSNLFKIVAFAFCVIVIVVTLCIATAIPSRAQSAATEPTDVYWTVHNGILILSGEQGNSGLTKWSKSSIASVNSEASVPWNSSRASIKEVRFYGPIAPTSTAFWFSGTSLTSFSATVDGTLYLDMSFVTDASRMFAACSDLATLDLSGVSAPLVTNIESIFDGCSKLKTLDISFLDGAPISEMMNAFYGCSSLTALDVSKLDISRVTDFTAVFYGCSSLKTLDLSALDGRNITTLESSFYNCKSLTSLTFGPRFDAAKVTSMENTFRRCESLTKLDLSGFNTSKVTDMSYTFAGCEALTELTLGSGFRCASVTTMKSMFNNCSALPSLDTSTWGASSVKDMTSTFSNCSSLKSLNLSGFSGAKPTDIYQLFSSASSLPSVDMSYINTESITNFESLFKNCSSLERFDLSSINTSAATDMSSMFQGCGSLSSFSFVGADTSAVTDMSSMFNECQSLISVDFTGIDTSKVTDISYMFRNCKKLKRLDLSDFDLSTSFSDSYAFDRTCYMLEMITAPKSIPASVSLSLDNTFFTGTEEITALTSAHSGDTVVRKFSIEYYWKNGTTTTPYKDLEPSYYYYGVSDVSITPTISENGYVFGGWTRSGSNELVSVIPKNHVGNISLYAKMTALQPIKPTITESPDVEITYGEGYRVNISFPEEELHSYLINWYRTSSPYSAGGTHVYDLRNQLGFEVPAFRFDYGSKIDTDTYYYCVITATRSDNGLSVTVTSDPIKVHIKRAQAEIVTHPTVIEGLIHNGSEQAVTTGGKTNNDKEINIVYSTTPNGPFAPGYNKLLHAGTNATIYYKATSTGNYLESPLYSLTYTIEAANTTLAWETTEQTVKYTGKEARIKAPTVERLHPDAAHGTITYSYTGSSSGTGLPVNAGTYTITATLNAGGDYKEATCSNTLTLTIEKVEAEVETPPSSIDSLTYRAEDIVLIQPGVTQHGTMEYSLDSEHWSTELPVGKNVGEYTVYYRVLPDGNHLPSSVDSIKVVIGKGTVTVSADQKTICLGTNLPTLTYTVTGLYGGDTLITPPTLTTEARGDALGTYKITIGGAAAGDNYTVKYVDGELSVLEHKWNSGAVTKAPNCTEQGEMTYTCEHDATHFYTEPIPVDEDAHAWDNGAVTTEPTCTEKGVKTFFCEHNKEHSYTEAMDALGHTYENDCDAECDRCGEARTPAEHADDDADAICDECGASLSKDALPKDALPNDSLPVGAIVAIVIGAVAVVGLGGFSLFWFVIKKKTFADLIGIFKK